MAAPKSIRGKAALSEEERAAISRRTKEGMERQRSAGVRLGRAPREDIPLEEIASDREQGMSWNRIARKYGIGKTTILSRKERIEGIILERRKEVEG